MGAEPEGDVGIVEVPRSVPKGEALELVPGRLYALQNLLELAGNVSAYPANATGFSVSNCYLLKEGNSAVLLDSGMAAHASPLIAQLSPLIRDGTRLSVYPLRINEYMSVGNVEALADAFGLEQCYSSNADAALWVDFGGRSDRKDAKFSPVTTTLVKRSQRIYVGDEVAG